MNALVGLSGCLLIDCRLKSSNCCSGLYSCRLMFRRCEIPVGGGGGEGGPPGVSSRGLRERVHGACWPLEGGKG